MNVDRCQLSGRDLALNNFQLKRAGQVREPREHAFLFFTLDLIAHVKLGKVSLRPAQRRTSDKTAVEIALTGRVRDSLFSNRQFGADKEILEDLQFGTIDMGGITNVVVANFEPTYQLIDLPFLFGHSAQTHDVSDGPVGQKIAENPRSSGAVSLGSFRNIIKIFAPFLHRKT